MNKLNFTTLKLSIMLLFLLLNSSIEVKSQEYSYREISVNLNTVWEIVWGPDNYLWVTERPGRVLRINPESGENNLILDISEEVSVGSERGLMGMTLSPNFNSDQFVYLSYTYESSGTLVRIVRYKYDGNSLVEPFIMIDNIKGARNHDGCRLAFGDDGKLYITTGDAAISSSAQDLTWLNGKILRLNQDGSIPEDNPFYGMSSRRNEIWSSGHRNPQGLVFHNGILYSSEHGSSTNDELNIIEKARNYGWPNVEGMCDKPSELDFCNENDVREPIAIYYSDRTLAVAGIDFYDVNENTPFAIAELNNSILMTTLKTGILMQIKLSEDGLSVIQEKNIVQGEYGRLRSVCVNPEGKIFIGTSNRDGRGTPDANDDKIIEITSVKSDIEKEKRNENILEVYPNPSYGELKIMSNSTTELEVEILDLIGNRIDKVSIMPNSIYEMKNMMLSSGYYILRATTEDKVENKFINIIR